VAEPVDPEVFLRAFLEGFFESQFVNGFLSTDRYHDLCADLQRNPRLAAVGRWLFECSPKPVQVADFGRLRLVQLREFDGSTFPFLQGLTQQREGAKRRKLACFLGHRFLKDIEDSLRFNLIHLFEPHTISLRWAGDDMSAADVFTKVLAGIRNADLCLFDNLATSNKPNVYIEIGIAYALGKPMLFCEHTGTAADTAFETASVPSDLQGLLRIQYASYQELCKKLYFGLPSFLKLHKLV
jgi:hypothetical protein